MWAARRVAAQARVEARPARRSAVPRAAEPSAAMFASMASEAIVSATDVTRRYGEGGAAVDALRGISLGFPPGAFTAIMGPSGSGKSTLMHILAGLDRPTSGTVVIDGQDITRMYDRALTLLS